MSGSGRKRVSKWDSKEEDIQHLSGSDYVGNSASYYHDKDPEGSGRKGSRRSVPDDDDDEQHLKSRQHPGEAWPPRSRVSHEEGDASMMSYYDTRKSSEQDESRQPYWDRPRTRRSGSRSNSRSISRSRSRSPLQRVRRDAGGSYDRHKTRAQSGRDVDGRYRDWEAKNRKTRDSNYYTEDSREQYPLRAGGRSDYSSDYPEDNNNNNSRRETQRRDVPEREYSRITNVPCRYFAVGNCRNGTSCRFSHHPPPARRSLERKPQDQMFSRHDSNNHTESIRNSHRWNERSDTGKSSEEAKGNNNGSWIGDMEMSPDWNYGVKTLKKPLIEEHCVVKDTSAPAYEHGSAAISQRIGMFPTVGEKTVASSHHGFSNNIANSTPSVQAFNQNIENHSAVPYQSTPLAVGGSQVMLPPPPAVTTHLPSGLTSNNHENGNAQNTVSREELNHISNISASLAQFFANGQPIPQLHSTLNPKQVPEVYGKEEQSSHAQSDLLSNSSVVPAVTALQTNNRDGLVSLGGNPKASYEENRDKKTDEEASKEPDGGKTEQEEKEAVEDRENVGEEEEEEGEDDENSKKEKDPKGMKAFKFALVEIVKELLKPAWKEGGMNKDAYKNIVKKAVDKVTGAMQTGNIPQTQEKIDHYLSASKPKLTKLVQAYISKVKKS